MKSILTTTILVLVCFAVGCGSAVDVNHHHDQHQVDLNVHHDPQKVDIHIHRDRKRRQKKQACPDCACGPECECGQRCPCGRGKTGKDVSGKAVEALDEVNAARAKRRLPPFQRDDKLTQGASAVAAYRARHRLAGHTRNDFDFLPKGAGARAAGCGALEDEWGWGTCCTYDRYQFAGAAWARGQDNKRYMHLFVR